MTKPIRTYGVFIDTAFNQVACIGTAEMYDNLSLVFNLVATPTTGKVILTPVDQKDNVVKLELVKK